MTWLFTHWSDTTLQFGFRWSFIAGSTTLFVAPIAVVRWMVELQHLGENLGKAGTRSLDRNALMQNLRFVRIVDRWILLIVLLPPLLLGIGYQVASRFVVSDLGVSRNTLAHFLTLLALLLASSGAGFGLFAALRTLTMSSALASVGGDYSPIRGTPSPSADALVKFCFRSALLFGSALILVLPLLVSSASLTSGAARWLIIALIVLLIGATVALLAWPAIKISATFEKERSRYLDELAQHIESVSAPLFESEESLGEVDYRQLRALLDIRSHVVTHALPQSSIEMVKRIPLAVMFPAASLLISLLSVH